MPTNLNALIRYKQIDICLRNRSKPCTIKILQEACSEALGEYRGVYRLISERTIRDDLRVMKSEMLGFNAPIIFEGGFYTYSNPMYSIFQVSFTDMKLMKDILNILVEAKDKIDNESILSVLEELSNLTGIALPIEIEQQPKVDSIQIHRIHTKQRVAKKSNKEIKIKRDFLIEIDLLDSVTNSAFDQDKSKFDWKKILDLV